MSIHDAEPAMEELRRVVQEIRGMAQAGDTGDVFDKAMDYAKDLLDSVDDQLPRRRRGWRRRDPRGFAVSAREIGRGGAVALRRYATYCARRRRFVQMNGRRGLYEDILRSA